MKQTLSALIYNYDEINITDDPEAGKIVINGGYKCVKRFQVHMVVHHSKQGKGPPRTI